MDKIAQLENRIAELESSLDLLSGQFKQALDYTKSDPQASLTKVRIILEKLISEIYLTEMKIESGNKSLGAMLMEEGFSKKIKPTILSRIHAIRNMTNIATHGGEVSTNDAIDILENLCAVFEWYLKTYKSGKGGLPKYRGLLYSFSKTLFSGAQKLFALLGIVVIVILIVIYFETRDNNLTHQPIVKTTELDENSKIKMIKNFIKDYQGAYKINDMDTLSEFYSEKFNFLGHADFTKDSLIRDKAYYFARWPERESFISSEIDVKKINDSLYNVSYNYHFKVKDAFNPKLPPKKGNMKSNIKVIIQEERPYIIEVGESKI